MWRQFTQRLSSWKEIFWGKALLIGASLWFVLGAWDLVKSELLPERNINYLCYSSFSRANPLNEEYLDISKRDGALAAQEAFAKADSILRAAKVPTFSVYNEVSSEDKTDYEYSVRAIARPPGYEIESIYHADFDGDGRPDAVVSVLGERPEFWRNVTPESGHWLDLKLVGARNNRDGIGTRIKVTTASGLVQYNHVTTAGSYASSNDPRVHFGLGADTVIKEIELKWPSGTVQVLHNVKADQVLPITEE